MARVWKVSDGAGFLTEPVLAQRNEYFADGTPAPRTAGASLQPFKYNGNEWIRAGGLDAYDFNARLYHPATLQFSSQDPLAEKYYATSPYAFCGGNPIRYSDPTGCRFEISSLSGEEQDLYNRVMTEARNNSELFDKLYCTLDESQTVYTIRIGETTTEGGNGSANGQYNGADNSITFSSAQHMTSPAVYVEEMFHAYQIGENADLYTEEFNFEFEAKVAKYAIERQFENSSAYLPLYSTEPGLDDFIRTFNYDIPSCNIVHSTNFLHMLYPKYANIYARYCIENDIGNQNYKTGTKQPPASLLKLYE